jgi:peroxiredoxin
VAESRGIDLSGRPPQAQTRERHRIKLPGFIVRGEIGLGDVIKRVTSAIGIKPCVGCERRAAFLNRWMAFSGSGRGTLQPGKRAPVFRLPDLQGRVVSLEEYQGRRVLLVFSDPHCGPCDELAPHLVRLHREHEKNGLSIILVGHGDADENRHKAVQHGFQFPVVLQKKWKLSKEYGTLATPAAFLIGQNGVIAKDAAVGRDAILALAGGGGG